MLDDLLHVIETLQQRIRDHGSTLRENETRTRMALIDPLLRVLGWDVSDPSVVTPEYNVGNGRADYALLNRDERPAALIEAKHFSEPLERPNHQEQVFTYALMQQVRYAGLTDGDRWILDNVSVFSGERRILDLSIAHTSAHVCALQLLLLWRPNLASGQPVEATGSILARDPVPEPAVPQQSTNRVPRASSGIWESLVEYDPAAHNQPPSVIRFEDGSTHSVQFWYELLASAAEWLWSKEYLTPSNIPVASGPKRYIISAEPVHQSGRNFASPQSIGSLPLWISKHGNKQTMFNRTQVLLRHCHIDPATVQLQVG